MIKEYQKSFMKKKWAVTKVGKTSVDLRKYSIKDTGGRSRKKHEDAPEGMYEKLMIVDEVEEYIEFC